MRHLRSRRRLSPDQDVTLVGLLREPATHSHRKPFRRRVASVLAVTLALGTVVYGATPSGATVTTDTSTVDATGTSTRTLALQVTAPGRVVLSLDWVEATADLNVFVKGPDRVRVASSTSRTARPEQLEFEVTQTGTYKVTVKAQTGASEYSLTVDYPGITQPTKPTYLASLGGGPSGHAEFYASGIDIDPAGNIYVADTGDDQIQKYSSDGMRLWVTGDRGKAAPGRYDNPRDLAYLGGKVYVGDTGNKRVQVLDATSPANAEPVVWSQRFGTIMGISAGRDKAGQPVILVADAQDSKIWVLTPSGVLVRTIGNGYGTGEGQLADVRDAATDAQGNVYVADYTNDRISVFSATGMWSRHIGTRGTAPGQLKRPYGVDFDAAGDLYVSDGNDEIDKYSPSGLLLRTYGSRGTGVGQFQNIRRVAVDDGPNPRVCGADLWDYKIACFTQDGKPGMTIGPTAPAPGFFNEPYDVAVDGEVFVMDTTNQRVQRFDETTGAFVASFGERGFGDGNPGLNWARGLTPVGGPEGTLWVADTKNSRLTEFQRTGDPTGRALGSFGSLPGKLNWPFAIASYQGDLIVADSKNNRIMRWNPNNALPTWIATGFADPKDVVVQGETIYVADTLNKQIVKLSAVDGVRTAALGAGILHAVEGVAVEPDGDIWVSDTSYNRLVQLSATGELVQVFGGAGTDHGRFNWPAHLRVRPGPPGTPDRLYVADMWNDRIEIFSLD
jgi:DNA-binding beta-propeller fold protein YncE